MRVLQDISYGPASLNLYLPEEGKAGAAFLYFHGGGLEKGDKGAAESFAPMLTEAGVAVVSANYRMYPTAHYPDFIEDAADAVAWTLQHAAEYGCGGPLYVGGSSAGGYLSMMLCFDRRYLAARGVAPDRIAGYIHDAGQPTCHFNVLRERGLDTRRVIVDESAPLWHVGLGEVYPPMLFIVSDQDMENRYEQTVLMLSTMRAFRLDMDRVKLKVMHGGHCHYLGRKDEQGRNLFGAMALGFIQGR